MRFIIVALVFFLSGCAYYEDRARDARSAEPWSAPVDSRVIHGDTQFTALERRAAEKACDEWAAFTRGRVRLSIAWDMDDRNFLDLPQPLLYRVNPSAETGTAGDRSPGGSIWWVPETCARWDMQACMMHAIGHLLGLEHFTNVRGQVMSDRNPARVFGVEDRQECINVGVCLPDRKRDVTTVTLTVDPSIPNVEPDYPRPIP